MNQYQLIERKVWRNKRTNQQASIYGSVPYYTDQQREEWEIIIDGYTIFDIKTNTYFRPNQIDKHDKTSMEQWINKQNCSI